MSNHLAIAMATETLVSILDQAVSTRVAGASAVHRRPDGSNGSGPPDIGINVYLFQVSPNPAFRGMDLPTRTAGGVVTQRPLIGLDLHYLLSFHGSDSDLEPQRCLGAAVQALQARPQLSRETIRNLLASLQAQDPGGFLIPSNLADQVDLVKFAPLDLTLDEMSKLWSVFFQTPYALSICYSASVVVIEADVTASTPLPVRERNISVGPIDPPFIQRVEPETVVFDSGEGFRVSGRGFRQTDIQAFIGNTQLPIEPGATNEEATIIPGAGVSAGVSLMRWELPSPFGAGHVGVSSNGYPVQVRPHLVAVSFVNARQVFRVQVSPEVGPTQRAVLLLTQFGNPMPANPTAFSIEVGRRDNPETVLEFDGSDVPAGTYLARIQIDGATSPLISNNANPPRFINPTVVRP